MTPTPLPGLDLDLDYPAADPAVRLAERAVQAGRRRRLRNRAGAGAAALLLSATAGSWWAAGTPGMPDGSVQVAAQPSGLPVALGRGPARGTFADPTYHGKEGDPAGLAPYPNRFVDLGSLVDGAAPRRAYLSRDGSFCIGTGKAGPPSELGSCRALDGLPAEGIWAASGVLIMNWQPGNNRTVDRSDLGVTVEGSVPGSVRVLRRSGTLLAVGVVRGPVTRVTVTVDGGREYPARLVPAPDPELGTVFAASLPWGPAAGGPVSASGPVTVSGADSVVGVWTEVPIAVTVERDGGPVFRCAEATCPGL